MPLLSEDRERIMNIYLTAACRKAYRRCLKYVDLLDRDDEYQSFNIDLDDDLIDILAEYMVSEWLKPKLYSDELLESRLNTKDFTEFSGAKMVEQLRLLCSEAEQAANVGINNYSFSHGDIAEVNRP
jgi:hypothetical protein